jgi:transcriptional regulator with XRE-family HTH domain
MTTKKPRLKIKKVLEQHKMSQYQLAERMGLQTQHITKMVRETYNPQFNTLIRIAEAIGCNVSDLIED